MIISTDIKNFLFLNLKGFSSVIQKKKRWIINMKWIAYIKKEKKKMDSKK